MPSRYVEMSYVSQPPLYDTRGRQPNGKPPGYLDNSLQEFPHDREHRYILDEHGYPLDDRSGGRGYAPEARGYDDGRDFGMMDQQRGFSQEYLDNTGGPVDRFYTHTFYTFLTKLILCNSNLYRKLEAIFCPFEIISVCQ